MTAARLVYGVSAATKSARALQCSPYETFTGGLCLVAIEPMCNYILLEHTAEARDQVPWSELIAGALAPLSATLSKRRVTKHRGFWRVSKTTSGCITRPTFSMCSMS
jgi:hypothetical protein